MDILIFIIALSVLVLVHEWGHFIAAIKTGVLVEEFGLGLPPKIFGKKWGKTLFSLNWLPIGGFCKLKGEEPPEEGKEITAKEKADSFFYKKPWQKMLVVLGGVTMNLVLAVAIFAVVYTVVGVPVETKRVTITGVAPGSPAHQAGLKEGDWVCKVEAIEISKVKELIDFTAKNKGKKIKLSLCKESGVVGEVEVLARENPPAGEGSLGVAISNTEIKKIAWWQFYEGIWAGFKEAYYWGKLIGGGVVKMIGGLVSGQVPKDVSGIVGMYQATSMIRKDQGLLALLHFFGIVSVNLAVVNVLPFPALDGGRMVFVIYEMLTKKRASQKFEGAVNSIGMIVLLGLMALITVSDVMRVMGR